MVNHPLLADTRPWTKLAIPLTVYGDGTAYTDTESIEFVAWSPLTLRQGTTLSTRYLAAAWAKSAERDKDTWRVIWEIQAWSLEACYAGTVLIGITSPSVAVFSFLFGKLSL